MQAIKCSECRQLVFMYDGDIRVRIDSRLATYPDGSKPAYGSRLKRACGHGRIWGRHNNTLYIDGEMETPAIPSASCESEPHDPTT